MPPRRSWPARGRAPYTGAKELPMLAEADQRTRTALPGKILVVDDEARILRFVVRGLQAEGFVVDSADNGADGLHKALEGRYDLVILDLLMPGMDGASVLRRLVAKRPAQAVLVLSCLTATATKVRCLEAGAEDYLAKPFSLDELLAPGRSRWLNASSCCCASSCSTPARPSPSSGCCRRSGTTTSIPAPTWSTSTSAGSGPSWAPTRSRPCEVRGIESPRTDRFGWPLRRFWLDLAWVGFALANLVAMALVPEWETVPFHFIWVSLTVLYGFRVWGQRVTAGLLTAVVLSTGTLLVHDVVHHAQPADGLGEVPLMGAMFLAMVWHAQRRRSAMEDLRRVSDANLRLLHRERQFIQDASHELRTPITVALGHAELVDRTSRARAGRGRPDRGRRAAAPAPLGRPPAAARHQRGPRLPCPLAGAGRAAPGRNLAALGADRPSVDSGCPAGSWPARPTSAPRRRAATPGVPGRGGRAARTAPRSARAGRLPAGRR